MKTIKFFKLIKKILRNITYDKFTLADIQFLRRNREDFIFFKNNKTALKDEILARKPINKRNLKEIPTQQQLDYLFCRDQEVMVCFGDCRSTCIITSMNVEYSNRIILRNAFNLQYTEYKNLDLEQSQRPLTIINQKKNAAITFTNSILACYPTGRYTFCENESDIGRAEFTFNGRIIENFKALEEL